MYFRQIILVGIQRVFKLYRGAELVGTSMICWLWFVHIFPWTGGGFGTEKTFPAPLKMHRAALPVTRGKVRVLGPLVLRT